MINRDNLNIQKIYFKDIGGINNIKQQLIPLTKYNRNQYELYEKYNIIPTIGILLYGPPGTGKTLIGKAIATESNYNFINIKVSQLIQGEIGESEKQIKYYFNLAKINSPCILFLDELDGFFNNNNNQQNIHYNRFITAFINQLDELKQFILLNYKPVLLICTTNYPNLIESSLLTEGRIDQHIYISPPNEIERYEIIYNLLIKIENIKYNLTIPDIHSLSQKIAMITNYYTGADLALISSRIHQIKMNLKNKTVDNSNQNDLDLKVDYILALFPESKVKVDLLLNIIPIYPSILEEQLEVY
ncbi:AAA-domain-containing protein, partial [Neoconidiobolus thromboides FSU 785]